MEATLPLMLNVHGSQAVKFFEQIQAVKVFQQMSGCQSILANARLKFVN